MNPAGETLDTFKYDEENTIITNIEYSKIGSLYALFVTNDKKANKKKVFIRKIDDRIGTIETEIIVYDGKYENSPDYGSLQLFENENFVLRKSVGFKSSIVTFSEFEIIDKNGDIKFRIPHKKSLQDMIIALWKLNEIFTDYN